MKKDQDKLTVILFCCVIAAFSLAFIILPHREFSEQENRALADAPEFDSERFFGGAYAEDVNVWFADQFPLRDALVKLKSGSELLMLKNSNDGVLYSHDQLAVKQFDAYSSTLYKLKDADGFFARSVAAQCQSLSRAAEKLDIPVVTLVPPRTIDIAGGTFGYSGHGDELFSLISEQLSESAGYIDMLAPLRDAYENGEYVIYRTDHHWTTSGAYAAYLKIMEKLGRGDEKIPEAQFKKETIPDFSGTTAAKANFPFYKKDELELWTLNDENEYSVVVDGKELGGFYSREYLERSDKYSGFLDGTHGLTTVTKTGVSDRPTLLVIKDSFANCLIPFLARSYDIVALDVKSGISLSSAAQQYGADAVLVICNAENVVSSGELGKIY